MVKKIFIALSCSVFLFFNFLAVDVLGQIDEGVKTFLSNLENAIYKMDTYRCIMISENWKGKKYEKKITRFQFKKPNLMRTDVLEGKKKGSSVVLNREGKIRGRNPMGFKKTLQPTDERLKNIRGYTFMQASLLDKLGRLKEHILERGCQANLNEVEWRENPAYHLHIDHSDSDDPVTDEDIWFAKETYIILKNLKYENETKVADTAWQDFEINITLEDSLFDQ